MSEAKRAATDTKSAAERVRHMAQGIVTSFEAMEAMMPFLKSDGQDGVLDAAVAVARAYLSLVPADSDEVIDEAWLRSAGFKGGGLGDCKSGLWLADDKCQVSHDGWWNIMGLPLKPKTRGDLRLLCRALSIPLTERTQ